MRFKERERGGKIVFKPSSSPIYFVGALTRSLHIELPTEKQAKQKGKKCPTKNDRQTDGKTE